MHVLAFYSVLAQFQRTSRYKIYDLAAHPPTLKIRVGRTQILPAELSSLALSADQYFPIP